MAKQKYMVLQPISHDKRLYKIGAMIMLEDGAEEQLLEVGAIEKPTQDDAAENTEKPEKVAKK